MNSQIAMLGRMPHVSGPDVDMFGCYLVSSDGCQIVGSPGVGGDFHNQSSSVTPNNGLVSESP